WRDYSACGTADPDSWFPPEDSNQYTVATAVKVCRTCCPVRGECLEFALENPEDAEYGVWAGLYRRELRRLRRERRKVAA
ncbi:MAG TPA: WhiB family transcriptional regulator, partial [Streptosporangiaceae bacterium]